MVKGGWEIVARGRGDRREERGGRDWAREIESWKTN